MNVPALWHTYATHIRLRVHVAFNVPWHMHAEFLESEAVEGSRDACAWRGAGAGGWGFESPW